MEIPILGAMAWQTLRRRTYKGLSSTNVAGVGKTQRISLDSVQYSRSYTQYSILSLPQFLS